MFTGKLNQKTLILLNFFTGGIIYSCLPTGFASLWVLGMQDNSASDDDVFRLVVYSTIIFVIGGIIGSLVTYLRTEMKRSASIGGLIPLMILIVFFLFQSEKTVGVMIFVSFVYVALGIVTGSISGFLAKKFRRMEIS